MDECGRSPENPERNLFTLLLGGVAGVLTLHVGCCWGPVRGVPACCLCVRGACRLKLVFKLGNVLLAVAVKSVVRLTCVLNGLLVESKSRSGCCCMTNQQAKQPSTTPVALSPRRSQHSKGLRFPNAKEHPLAHGNDGQHTSLASDVLVSCHNFEPRNAHAFVLGMASGARTACLSEDAKGSAHMTPTHCHH